MLCSYFVYSFVDFAGFLSMTNSRATHKRSESVTPVLAQDLHFGKFTSIITYTWAGTITECWVVMSLLNFIDDLIDLKVNRG